MEVFKEAVLVRKYSSEFLFISRFIHHNVHFWRKHSSGSLAERASRTKRDTCRVFVSLRHGSYKGSTFCLFAEKEIFNHNISTALSPVRNLCVAVWSTDEDNMKFSSPFYNVTFFASLSDM